MWPRKIDGNNVSKWYNAVTEHVGSWKSTKLRESKSQKSRKCTIVYLTTEPGIRKMKYLNPGFDSVVDRLKLRLALLLRGYNNAQLFMYMYMYCFQACTYPETHPSKSYTDWLLAATHPCSQHLQYRAKVSLSMAPNHGCQGERSIMQYDSKTFYLQQNIIINNWNLRNKTLMHAIVYGLMIDYNQKHKNMVQVAENYKIIRH